MITWQPGMTLDDLEKEVILKCIRYTEGNKTKAAQTLGVTVKTIYNKLEKYGIPLTALEKKEISEELPRTKK